MYYKKFIYRGGLLAIIAVQGLSFYQSTPDISEEILSDSLNSRGGVFAENTPSPIQGIVLLGEQLRSAPPEQAKKIADDLEGQLVKLLESDDKSLGEKLLAYQALTDVDLADRVLYDLVAAITREVSITEALKISNQLNLELGGNAKEEFVAARFETAPAESVNWLLTHADDELKHELLPELVSQWATEDLKATESFIREIPYSDPTKDKAVGLFIHTVVRSHPALAKQLVTLVNENEYQQYLKEEISLIHPNL